MTTTKQFPTIEEYIKAYPTNVQSILGQIRQIIHDAAPDATETISYQIPTFKLNGQDLYTLLPGKTILPCIRYPQVQTHLKKNYLHT